MMRESLGQAHTVGLRDKDVSQQALKDLGIDVGRARLVEIGDDTLDLTPQEPKWDCFAPQWAERLRSGGFFGVHWRSSDYTHTLSATEQILPLAEAIRQINEMTGLPAVFLPFSWEVGSSDTVAAARLHDYLQGTVPFYVAWNYLAAAELKWLLSLARFGIGLSYHFHVFLLSQGRPSIGLYTNDYYNIKLNGAFKAYGYQGTPIKYQPEFVAGDSLKTAVELAMAWTDSDSQLLRSNADDLRYAWHVAFQDFLRDSRLSS